MDRYTQADYVELALGSTETTETKLGTITMPSGAPTGKFKIIGIYAIIHGVTTTGEENSGYARLSFGTVSGVYKFPAQVHYAGAGTLVGPPASFEPKIIAVDIDVPANEKLDAYMATFVAATGAIRGMVGIIFRAM